VTWCLMYLTSGCKSEECNSFLLLDFIAKVCISSHLCASLVLGLFYREWWNFLVVSIIECRLHQNKFLTMRNIFLFSKWLMIQCASRVPWTPNIQWVYKTLLFTLWGRRFVFCATGGSESCCGRGAGDSWCW